MVKVSGGRTTNFSLIHPTTIGTAPHFAFVLAHNCILINNLTLIFLHLRLRPPLACMMRWEGPSTHSDSAVDCLPSTRPSSVQNSILSVQHPDFHIPPDDYIPTLNQDRRISLPLPHELRREIPLLSHSQPVTGPSAEPTRTYRYPPCRFSPEFIASTKI